MLEPDRRPVSNRRLFLKSTSKSDGTAFGRRFEERMLIRHGHSHISVQ